MPLKIMDLVDGITWDADDLVEEIRQYSRSQKPIWQRVPMAALSEDGIAGYSSKNAKAYQLGLWEVDRFYVDLATGNLVYASWSNNESKYKPGSLILSPARSEFVLNMAFNLEDLNAPAIINHLEEETKRKSSSAWFNKKEHDKWKEKMIKELKLSEVFTR